MKTETEINLILGGAGFIGSNVAEALASQNRRVICIDDESLGNMEYLTARKIGNNSIIIGDINNNATWNTVKELVGAEAVHFWHLAANSDISAGAFSLNPDYFKTLSTTVSLINNLKDFNVKRISFSSTSAVYGEDSAFPSETSPTNPISNYGAAKLSSELFLKIHCNRENIPLLIFRFANIVGIPATHGVVFDFLNRIKNKTEKLEVKGNGTQQKSYLHSKDLVELMLQLVKHNHAGTWNLGLNDEGLRVSEIAELVVSHAAPNASIEYGIKPIGWPGDVNKISMNCSKINAEKFRIQFTSSYEAIHQAIHDVCTQLNLEFKCPNVS